MFKLSHRTKKLRPSATLAFQEKLCAMRAEGQDIIYLNSGEPDFDTPMNIKAQAIEAIHEGHSKYTAVRGMPELIEAIIKEYQQIKNLDYSNKQVMVANGAKQALFNLLFTLIEDEDEIIIASPCWPSYFDMVYAVGGKIVEVKTELKNNFQMSAIELEKAITPKTKCVIFNSPSNPTGQIISKKSYLEYAEVLKKHPDIVIISDDVYELINWDPHITHWLEAVPEMIDRTVIINSVSKSFAMTGWRLGYALGPEAIITPMVAYQSQSTSNVCSIAQCAAIEALTGDRYSLTEMLIAYKQRHDLMYQMLSSSELIKLLKSYGTFYMFPDVSLVLEKFSLPDADALSLFLLEKTKVGIIPGNSFGSKTNLRFSFTNKYDKIEEALTRVLEVIDN